MAISADPVKRKHQLANLQRGAATKHGTNSATVMAPLRAEAELWASSRWPWLDSVRLVLVADLAARVNRVRIWSDEHDIIHSRGVRAVQAHPIVDSADRWQARLDTMIQRLDAETRERSRPKPVDVDAELAAIAAGDVP